MERGSGKRNCADDCQEKEEMQGKVVENGRGRYKVMGREKQETHKGEKDGEREIMLLMQGNVREEMERGKVMGNFRLRCR